MAMNMSKFYYTCYLACMVNSSSTLLSLSSPPSPHLSVLRASVFFKRHQSPAENFRVQLMLQDDKNQSQVNTESFSLSSF